MGDVFAWMAIGWLALLLLLIAGGLVWLVMGDEPEQEDVFDHWFDSH